MDYHQITLISPSLELYNGQVWRKDETRESAVALQNQAAMLRKVFKKSLIYVHTTMLGVIGIMLIERPRP